MKVTINRFDDSGNGITTDLGKVTFVPKTLPEEEIEIEIIEEKKNYQNARCKNILKTSINRVIAPCPYFEACGGCDLQHMSYENTLSFKRDKVQSILKRNALITCDISIIPSKEIFHYRNKVSLKIKDNKIGYYKKNSHELVAIDCCLLAEPAINKVLEKLNQEILPDGNLTIRSNYNDELLLIFETNDHLNIDWDSYLPTHKLVGVIENKKCIFGEDHFMERLDHHLFQVSYDSFFQVNRYVCEELFQIIKQNSKEEEIVMDLYCGVGSLGIEIYEIAKRVYGVEIIPNAIKNALKNAKINKCSNIQYFLGDVSKILPKIPQKPSLIMIDPPRSGLDKNTIKNILEMNPQRMIYISCNPITLARDLKDLQKSYEIKTITALDMFPWTSHVESVCVLNKR